MLGGVGGGELGGEGGGLGGGTMGGGSEGEPEGGGRGGGGSGGGGGDGGDGGGFGQRSGWGMFSISHMSVKGMCSSSCSFLWTGVVQSSSSSPPVSSEFGFSPK